MKNIILLMILLFNTSCGPSMSNLSYEEKISYKLMQEFGKEMASCGYCLTSVGLKGPNQKIESFTIRFEVKEDLTFATSRQYVVNLTQKFVSKINAQKELTPYLIVAPITQDQVSVLLCGLDPCQNDANYVKSAMAIEGRLVYFDGTMEHPRFGFLKRESWEEALKMLADEKLPL